MAHQQDQDQDATRFTTQDLGRYTAEYDHQARELRLAWSGGQTFLDLDECYRLADLLNTVLPRRPFEQPVSKQPKPYHVQCFVKRHVAHEERFEDKEVALSYARKMQGQWTNNTPDGQFHQFTRIVIEEYGRLVSEWTIGLRDQGRPPESEGEQA